MSRHSPEGPQPSRRTRDVIVFAAVCVGALLVGALAHPPAADARGPRVAQTPEAPVVVPGETIPPGQTEPSVRTGPDPTGQPLPPRRNRIIDTAIWLWLVALLGALGVAVVRGVRAVGPTGDAPGPLVDLDPPDRSRPDP